MVSHEELLCTGAENFQWNKPESCGDVHFTDVIGGGLHMEMVPWKTHGDILHGSGMTVAVREAEISTSELIPS